MQVVLRLLPVEYHDGLVIQRFREKPIAESGILEVRNAAKLRDAIDSFLTPYRASVDAKLYVYGYGRKFAGFDAEAKYPRELHKAA
jgi:hypothetical protein